MQEQRYLGRLEPGMDVCDVDGNKFGSIGRVYRHEMATAISGSGASGVGTMPREESVRAVWRYPGCDLGLRVREPTQGPRRRAGLGRQARLPRRAELSPPEALEDLFNRHRGGVKPDDFWFGAEPRHL